MNNPLATLLSGFGKASNFVGNAEAALVSPGHAVPMDTGGAPDFDTLNGYQGGAGIHMYQPPIIRH